MANIEGETEASGTLREFPFDLDSRDVREVSRHQVAKVEQYLAEISQVLIISIMLFGVVLCFIHA